MLWSKNQFTFSNCCIYPFHEIIPSTSWPLYPDHPPDPLPISPALHPLHPLKHPRGLAHQVELLEPKVSPVQGSHLHALPPHHLLCPGVPSCPKQLAQAVAAEQGGGGDHYLEPEAVKILCPVLPNIDSKMLKTQERGTL